MFTIHLSSEDGDAPNDIKLKAIKTPTEQTSDDYPNYLRGGIRKTYLIETKSNTITAQVTQKDISTFYSKTREK